MRESRTSRLTSVLTLNCERGLGVVEVSPVTRHKAGDKRAMRGALLMRPPYLKGMELGCSHPRGLASQNTTAKILEVVKEELRGAVEHPEHREEP